MLTNPHRCVIDREGYYVTFVLLVEQPEGDPIPYAYELNPGESLVEAQAPGNMITPRWNGSEWEETGTRELTPEDIENLKKSKLQEVGSACTSAIYAGVALELGGEVYSFSYNNEDQANIAEIKQTLLSAALGIPVDYDLSNGIPYHANGKLCTPWSQNDFTEITTKLSKNKLYHTTYCNHLNMWIRREDDYYVLLAISYGAELPADLAVNMSALLGTTEGAI